MPDFSILIPNLGYESYIFDCLSSIFNQTNNFRYTFEVVFRDQSEIEIHNKLKKEINKKYLGNVRIIYSKIKSLYKARHRLMKYATGDYVIFIDSDDYLLDGFLDKVFVYFKSNPKIDILIHDLIYIDEKGVRLEQIEKPKDLENNIKLYFYFSYCINPVCAKIFKNELYNYNDYFIQDVNNSEDKFFSLIQEASNISFEREIKFYCYRQRKESVVHNLTPNIVLDVLNLPDVIKPLTKYEQIIFINYEALYFLSSILSLFKVKRCNISQYRFLRKKIKNRIKKTPLKREDILPFSYYIFLIIVISTPTLFSFLCFLKSLRSLRDIIL